MSSWPTKDPDDILDYVFDWRPDENPCLEVGETILASTVTVVEGGYVAILYPLGLQIDAADHDGSKVTVWLTGGVAGDICKVTNHIVTSEGREYDKTASLRIRER